MPGSNKFKPNELRSKSKADLLKSIEELKRELVDLRVHKATNGSPGKLSRIPVVKRTIARILTIMNQKTRQNLQEFYKGNRAKPLDLRKKQTRAIRRRLSSKELRAKTLRQQKREIHFPVRRSFAVKA